MVSSTVNRASLPKDASNARARSGQVVKKQLNRSSEGTEEDIVSPKEGVDEASFVPKTFKVHIQLTEKAYNRLVALKEKADLVSVSEVVREALRVYDVLIDETSAGKSIFLQNPKAPNERELIRLF